MFALVTGVWGVGHQGEVPCTRQIGPRGHACPSWLPFHG